MESVGLAVGVVGLAGLFSSCIEAFDRVQSYRTFDVDSQDLETQFKGDKLRLERWGQQVGFSKGQLAKDHHPALDDSETSSQVKRLLFTITRVCDASEKEWSGAQSAISTSNKGTGSRTVQSSGSRWRKLAWAVRNKGEKAKQVSLLGTFVQQLHDLVPPESSSSAQPVNASLLDELSLQWALSDEIRRSVAKLGEEMEVEVRREIHSWLLGRHSLNERYEDSIQKKLGGTCDWILDRSSFTEWLSWEFSDDTAKLLWINGPAGFGKTILCARIVEYLTSTLSTPVAHFFSSADFESREDPFVAFRSWVSQLVFSNNDAFDIVRKQWGGAEQHQIATRGIVTKLFGEILQAVPGCTIILDGLDECSPINTSVSISNFVESIRDLISGTLTRVLIVSRDEAEIRQSLQIEAHEAFSEYRISTQDVKADTESYSSSIVSKKLANKSQNDKDHISETMARRCEGQFLWLKMQEDSLRGGLNKKQLQRTINEEPVGLGRVYERNWHRIEGLHERERNRAISLLRWTAFAQRPLTVCEITEAVLVDENCEDFPMDDLPDAIDDEYVDSEILGLCGSLLEVQSTSSAVPLGSKTVHLTHFTVKQFLLTILSLNGSIVAINERLRISNEIKEHSLLAKLAMQYVNLARLWDDSQEPGGLGSCFKTYAATSWHHHLKLGTTDEMDVSKMTAKFVDANNPNWHAWCEWFDSVTPVQKSLGIPRPSPLYYAARLGLTKLVSSMLRSNPDWVNPADNQKAPLIAACMAADQDIVQILLEQGATITQTDGSGKTAIHVAATSGHAGIVKLLLANGADIATPDHIGWTPLYTAVDRGASDIAELLLEEGTDPFMTNNREALLLGIASSHGYLEIARLLLRKGADPTKNDNDASTPALHTAITRGFLAVLTLFLEEGASPNVHNYRGGTALDSACLHGRTDMIAPLIDNGVDIEAANKYGLTPLHVAALHGHVAVAKILIDRGAKVRVKGGGGWTPLNSASSNGHVEIMGMLIDNGASLEEHNDYGWTPLHTASANAQSKAVELLLDRGASITAKSVEGITPLIKAASRGHTDVVAMLLDKYPVQPIREKTPSGIDTALETTTGSHDGVEELTLSPEAYANYSSEGGWTALIEAAIGGHLATAVVLLDRGADIELVTKPGWNSLRVAAEHGHYEVVKLLLDRGAQIEARNPGGWTALLLAAEFGNHRTVELLLDRGASVNTSNEEGWSPLPMAADEGHLETVKVLLERGADVASRSKNGWDALLSAVDRGHLDIVKLLVERGARIESETDEGARCVRSAAGNGHIEVIKYLVDKEANLAPFLEDEFCSGPLFYSAKKGQHEMVSYLLSLDIFDPSKRNIYGLTPLTTAVANGHVSTVEILLPVTDLSLDTKDKLGRTLMQWAALGGSSAVSEMLLQRAKDSGISVAEGDMDVKNLGVKREEIERHPTMWCNVCTLNVPAKANHYHCDTCYAGDFDMCEECYELGMRCEGEAHEMRLVLNEAKKGDEDG